MGDMNPETPEKQQHVSKTREKASASKMRKTEAKENTQRGEMSKLRYFAFQYNTGCLKKNVT